MRDMKNILMCLACTLLAVSCTRVQLEDSIVMEPGEGVLTVNVDFSTETRADAVAVENFKMRIYQIGSDGQGGETMGLVRKYASLAEIPEYIWLMEGNYCVKVEAGNKVGASFTDRYFAAEKRFAIVPQKIATVDIDADMQNIPVEVKFDSTISETLTGAYAYVSTGATFDDEAVRKSSVPALKYEQTATGYFMLPEGCTDLCWKFHGEHAELGTIEQTGTIAGVEPMTLYSLTFRYSADGAGTLVFTATVDTSVVHRKDNIPFNPDPVVKGVGFDMKQSYDYTGGERTYNITALDNITLLSISGANGEYNLLSGSHAGIKVEQVNGKNYNVTLSDDFFATLPGGYNELTIRINDASGGIGVVKVTYGIQGIVAITKSQEAAWIWRGTADFTGIAFGTPNKVEAAYREVGGTWKKFAASKTTGSTYFVAAEDLTAGKTYEYTLFVNDQQVGNIYTVVTPAGQQIKEADFENWIEDDGCWYPCSSIASEFWSSGNEGSKIAGINLTVPSDDVRPGSTGKKSAYMHSAKAAVMGIGKFAAGNIYIGDFAGLQGTNGLVDFGRPFNFTARPKALKFWYKNFNGEIDEKTSVQSGTDLTKIFVCVCNWEKPHRVNTSKEDTYFDPATGHYDGIIGTGYFTTQEHVAQWTEKTIEIVYNDETTIPNYLVVTFTCSGYGDYFCGSTDSWMYVDDIELVY